MPSTTRPVSDAALAQSLAKLWPHRMHESSWLKNACCAMHLHRWAQLDLSQIAPGREVWFCRWCDRIKIDGARFGDQESSGGWVSACGVHAQTGMPRANRPAACPVRPGVRWDPVPGDPARAGPGKYQHHSNSHSDFWRQGAHRAFREIQFWNQQRKGLPPSGGVSRPE